MKKGNTILTMLCALTILWGCASIDSQISKDLRISLTNTTEIGYGIGQGANVELLGKVIDKEKINDIVEKIKFGKESEISVQEPFNKYIFFMSKDKTMTILRFEEDMIQYQNKEYKMDKETKGLLNEYYQ
jgi:hypothetical protein